MTTLETQIVGLAIGRMLRMAARPTQPGDVAEYWRCRDIILSLCQPQPDHAPSYVRDRFKGAQGD